MSRAASTTHEIALYKAEDGWRWRYRAGNDRILADGGQGYSNRVDCIRGLELVTGGTVSRNRSTAATWYGVLRRQHHRDVPVVIEP